MWIDITVALASALIGTYIPAASSPPKPPPLYTHFFTPKNPSTQHYSRYPIKYQTNKSDELKTQTRHNLAFVLGWGQDSSLKIFSSQEKVFTFCLIFFTICAEKVCYKVCNACYKVSNTCYKVCNTCYKLCNKNFLIG